MDHMDLDPVLEVPDTPDRLATQANTLANGLEKQNLSFKSGPIGKGKLFCEASKNRLESSDDVSGRQIHPPRGFSRSGKSGHHGHNMAFESGDSSSSRNSPLFRRKVADKGLDYDNKNSDYLPNIQSKKSLFTSQSSVGRDSAVVDLTECNGHAPVLRKPFPSRIPGVTQAQEFNKGSVLGDSCSSYSRANSSLILNGANEERHLKVADKVDAGHDCVHGVDNDNDAQPNARKNNSVILNSITLPRAPRQKRLVRNGCISPINIAKGKQPVEKDSDGSVSMGESVSGPVASNTSMSRIDVRDIVAEDSNSNSLKGKGVLKHSFSLNGSDVRSTHKSSRNSVRINENASRDAVRNFAKSDGWRTAHSQSRKLNTLVSRQGQHISIDNGGCFDNGDNGSKEMRKENEDIGRTVHKNSDGKISDASARPARQASSRLGPQFSETNACYMAKDTLAKRQRQGSTSSGLAECSRSAANDSDIMFIGSSGYTTTSRLTENQNHNGAGITESVIDIDEVTPEVRRVSSRAIGFSGINEDATVTQVELDEMLARELQEQFYSEDPAVGTGERIDSHIALALQQEEESHRTISRGRQPVSNPRGSSYRNLPRTGARAPSSSRMARLRNRFPGQPRTISSSRGGNSTMLSTRERNSLFPADMDVDMRIHILEALESFSNMGVGSSFLQMQRDFNENDYEMLLALDDNNHQHGGATTHQINGLPESTVQSDNLEEACAICLDSPAVGDIVRHLPCLHKFHKDCIDPWLRRRTSCPVCKSSIT